MDFNARTGMEGVSRWRGGLPLDGMRILVADHDYQLSAETAHALRGSGAHLVGPCADVSSAMRQILIRDLDCGVIDLDLGHGISFLLASELLSRRIPTVFVTAITAALIPAHFARGATYLQKPVDYGVLVAAVAKHRRA